MVRIFAAMSWLLVATTLSAQETEGLTPVDAWRADPSAIFDAASVRIDDFVWLARPVIVFADSPNDPRFVQQIDLLTARLDDLSDRDVIIVTDTDPDAETDLRLQLRPRGFMLVIMGKDGEVELRKPAPWNVREISRSIDKMPLRQQEINEARGL